MYAYVFKTLKYEGRQTGVDVMISIFGDFLPICGEKSAFFSKNNVMIKFLPKTAVLREKTPIILPYFSAKIFLKSQHRSLVGRCQEKKC
jgi:hypothetical protein